MKKGIRIKFLAQEQKYQSTSVLPRMPLIGYATHYLAVESEWSEKPTEHCAVVNKMSASSSRFRSVCEEDLDRFWIIVFERLVDFTLRLFVLDFYAGELR